MLNRCVPLLGGRVRFIERESGRKKELGEASISLDLSIQLKDITVRIIHAGGREELYRNAIPASQLLQKYPGMCVARPEVFKKPHESVLLAEEKLFPGNKYYIIPSTTVQKLKRKHTENGKVEEPDEGKGAIVDRKVVADVPGDCSDESICSANDFYVSKERWSRCILQKCRDGKKPFVPPIQKPRINRNFGWEPSLTSIQELSP